jgi:hypothetical protein
VWKLPHHLREDDSYQEEVDTQPELGKIGEDITSTLMAVFKVDASQYSEGR